MTHLGFMYRTQAQHALRLYSQPDPLTAPVGDLYVVTIATIIDDWPVAAFKTEAEATAWINALTVDELQERQDTMKNLWSRDGGETWVTLNVVGFLAGRPVSNRVYRSGDGLPEHLETVFWE